MSRKEIDRELERHPVVGSEPRADIFGRIGLHPDRLRVRGLPMEVRVFAKSVFRNDTPKPFVIYGRPRSGTTLLVRLLDQLPAVRCEGELLHYFLLNPVGFLKRLPRRAGDGVQAYGIKLVSYHLMEIQRIRRPLAFFDKLGGFSYGVIHLTRNTWDQTLSLVKAQESGVYFSNNGSDPLTLRIDPDRFLAQLKWNEDMLAYENEVMANVEHCPVSYDSHLKDAERHQPTIDRLAAYLGVASAPVTTNMQRTGGSGGIHKVENMEEIVKRVHASEFAHLVPRE